MLDEKWYGLSGSHQAELSDGDDRRDIMLGTNTSVRSLGETRNLSRSTLLGGGHLGLNGGGGQYGFNRVGTNGNAHEQHQNNSGIHVDSR